MSSHVDSEVNNKFLIWLNKKYGEYPKVTAMQGNIHDYLRIKSEFKKGSLFIDMIEYIKKML